MIHINVNKIPKCYEFIDILAMDIVNLPQSIQIILWIASVWFFETNTVTKICFNFIPE